MFYYNNNLLRIFSPSRCGSINMRYYFKRYPFRFLSDTGFPEEFDNNLIVVLRNPLDRVVSAVTGIPPTLTTQYIAGFKRVITPPSVRAMLESAYGVLTYEIDEDIKEYITFTHCAPFMHRLVGQEFRIIDFNKLSDYIPVPDSTDSLSPVTHTSGNTDPSSVYVPNRYFTLDDLTTEYTTYLSLLNSVPQISVAEWTEKT